jgi:two-component system, NarL family, sensor histidine kinase NreB
VKDFLQRLQVPITSVNDHEPAESPQSRAERLQLQMMSRAIEQTADSVFITDRNGIIQYVNPAFQQLTGFRSAEAIGNTPRIFKSGRHDTRFYANLWKTILSGRTHRFVVTNRSKDGRLYDEDQTITPIRDEEGAITHFVATGRDITSRKRAIEALRRLNSQLERESGRIAGVLHDEAGQFLTFAHITLADIARDVAPEIQARLQEVRRHLDHVEHDLRRVSHEIHPSILDDLGLLEAIRFHADSFSRRTGVRVTVDADLEQACPRAIQTVIYRLVQEALTNLGKHANAQAATIALRAEGTAIQCVIRDDGRGFDVQAVHSKNAARRGLGLTLIQDRLEAFGGTLQIISAPGQGTQLRTTIPLGL